MKTIILSAVLSLHLSMATISLAQTAFTINMQLTGFNDSTKFTLLNLDSGETTDSAYIYKGIVSFKGKVTNPVAARIHTIDNKYLIIYLENKVINVIGNYDDYEFSQIKGSDINVIWLKSRDYQKNLQIQRNKLIKQYFALNDSNKHLGKSIGSEINKIDSTVLKYRLAFIKNEKPSFFTLNELYFLRNDLERDSLRHLFEKFPNKLQTLKQGLVLSKYINNPRPEIGMKFINIGGNDIYGNKSMLSDLKAQYILLDFWASWCAPCRQENPEFIKIYEKYKDKGFEIYGFSTDLNKTSWINAVKLDKLPWTNVSDLEGFYSKGVANYQVRAIPMNFLIDKNGIIVARNLRGKSLAEMLKQLLPEVP